MKPALCFVLFLAVSASAQQLTEDERMLAYSKACAAAAIPGQVVRGAGNTSEAYFLTAADGRPRVSLDVDLRYWPGGMTEKEMDAAVGQMEISRQAIIKFYGNYGITVEPVFHHQRREPQIAGKDHFVVYLAKFMDGMQSMNWGVNASWPQREREMIHTHEFGHLLGLKDEYETPRAVRLGEPDNIMRNWDAPDGRLYLRQIKEILAPMCPAL